MSDDSQSTRTLGVAILGSTGSIGTQTLDVIERLPDRFRVVALAANRNSALLAQQVARHHPEIVVCDAVDGADFGSAARRGEAGMIDGATHPDVDIVVVATSGHAAIIPTFAAVEARKTIAIANKETIVCAGELLFHRARELGVPIRPVDSEHSAIWQAIGGQPGHSVARLFLTASGGPFRESPADLSAVRVEDALKHPTWKMGGKVTIDSATLMNKGLELIEAHWLFDVSYDNIEIIVHPESIVHSVVEFVDGSQIAQMNVPDMRIPIQYALTYPDRCPTPARRFSLAEFAQLRFTPPDLVRFPALDLARSAGTVGMTMPTVMSAADDVAVDAFVRNEIPFPAIVETVARTMDRHRPEPITSLEVVAAADRWARETATSELARFFR